MELAGYIGLKLVAYVGWCLFGLRLASRDLGFLRFFALGTGFGIARLLIGWVVGIGVGLLVLTGTAAPVVLYFVVLIPTRWLEWGIVEPWIFKEGSELSALIGRAPNSRLWRLGGIAVSCAADLPFLLGKGFPTGRMFC